MTDEERRIITSFVERVSGAANAAPRPASPWGGMGGGAQPAAQPLPPVDPEADRLINDLFARYPEARYRITQMAFVQEAALVEMQNRIKQLEWEAENNRRQAEAAQSRTGLSGLFGGGRGPAPMPPRPQPQYPPGYNPGMLQQQGGGRGFLGTALMTAAGVAGGLVLGNALMSAFSGGGAAHAASAAGAGAFGQDAVPASSPWTDPGAAAAEPAAWGNDAQPADDPGYGSDANNDAGAYDDGGGYDDEEI
ncbi:DUF2076 domain-containing protein [Falsiroseomonas sp. HW251]|uniref:DUF2076 domain-containing protein n=1 Tax=Falsiroseomonas sp. HW251 TaxID=3390998 RepID=UPI003D31C2D5